jgi:TRAP-type uncharacterized transport system fused permease subunit
MASPSNKMLKVCLYIVLFFIPIICLICGIIIEKEGVVIGGTMGILLAFIISILLEFHERQAERRQNSIRILVNSITTSMRNIRIEIAPTSLTILEAISDDIHININESVSSINICGIGAAKDLSSEENMAQENI